MPSKNLPIAFVLTFAVLAGASAQTPRTVVIRAARMLDPVAGRLVPNASVVVTGERIESVGGTPPSGAPAIDLGDVTLLPGLIDSHTHNLLQPEDELPPPVLTKSQAYRAIEGVAAAKRNLE